MTAFCTLVSRSILLLDVFHGGEGTRLSVVRMKKANASTFDSVDQAAWSSLPSPGVRQSRVCWEESPGP